MGFNSFYSTPIFFYCLLLSSFLFTVNADHKLEAEAEPSFSYVMGAWNGPQNWGRLSPDWALCGTGKSQSPIDIHDHRVVFSPSLGDLDKRYKPAPAILRSKGHEVVVEWTGDAGGIIINGNEYKLLQCHWHTPAEHKFNRKGYCAELHAVHSNSHGDIAVVGILYELGLPDPFLSLILPYVPSAGYEGTDLGVVNPFWINFEDREYYRYNGSLTTPPCTENVTWTVFKTVRTVSKNQVSALRNAIQDGHVGNARPAQPLNGRTVYSFRPSSSI